MGLRILRHRRQPIVGRERRSLREEYFASALDNRSEASRRQAAETHRDVAEKSKDTVKRCESIDEASLDYEISDDNDDEYVTAEEEAFTDSDDDDNNLGVLGMLTRFKQSMSGNDTVVDELRPEEDKQKANDSASRRSSSSASSWVLVDGDGSIMDRGYRIADEKRKIAAGRRNAENEADDKVLDDLDRYFEPTIRQRSIDESGEEKTDEGMKNKNEDEAGRTVFADYAKNSRRKQKETVDRYLDECQVV